MKLRVFAGLKKEGFSSREATQYLGVSQPVFSRLVRAHLEDLVIIGKAQKTKYALRRVIEGIEKEIPFRQINGDGSAKLLGHFIPIEPTGFAFIVSDLSWGESRIFPDTPYFLEDVRPSGFLGRLIPRQHPEFEFPTDTRLWSTNDCFIYWTKFGWNLIGGWVIGTPAFELYLKQLKIKKEWIRSEDRKKYYPLWSNELAERDLGGSSAGGEQPKFLAGIIETGQSQIVKFTKKIENEVDQRTSDLLVCESVALDLLRAHHYESSHAEIIQSQGQTFLQVERFDRTEILGRRAIISLRALGLFYGASIDRRWSEIASQIEKVVSRRDIERISELECFGYLIGNSDLHAGNISFYFSENGSHSLAPVYDMLPMAYYPQAGGAIHSKVADFEVTPRFTRSTWEKMRVLALVFWGRCAQDERISKAFRELCLKNKEAVDGLEQEMRRLP